MNSKLGISALIVVIMVVTTASMASAAPDPVPMPGNHTQLILNYLPELAVYPAEPWIMTGYRLFYNLYYYDKDDNITGEELIVLDTVGIGGSYLLTQLYSALLDEDGNTVSFEHTGYRVDHTGIGEFWISLEAFADENSMARKSGLFTLEDYDWNGKPEEAWYAYITTEDGSADYEYYYSNIDGLLLSLDLYEYDDEGNYIGGAAIKFDVYYGYEAPWLDFGLMEMPEGLFMEYDMVVRFADGTEAKGIMDFTVEENHFSWAYVTQELYSSELGNSAGSKIMSEMCTDGLILWLPRGVITAHDEGAYFFDESITGSYILVNGLEEVEGLGSAMKITFVNGRFKADSYFGIDDGALLKYHQHPNQVQDFDLILTLKGIM